MVFKRRKIFNSLLLLAVLMGMSLLTPKPVRADLIIPPAEMIMTPLSLALLLANLAINFLIFGFAYWVFVEKRLEKIEKKAFFIALVLMTIIGFFLDSLVLEFWRYERAFTASLILGALIGVSDYLICRTILKLEHKKALKLGIWMAVFTNPYAFFMIAIILSLPLSIFSYRGISPDVFH